MSDPIYRLVHDGTRVLSLAPAVGKAYPPKGQFVFDGTQAEIAAKIDALKLAPLPDPALAAARIAKVGELSAALKAALIAQFESAPLGGQWQFDPVRAGCNAALTKGDLASAIQGLEDTLSHNLVPVAFAPIVTACIGLIQAAGPKFVAAQAATTLNAVNALAFAPAAPAPAPATAS